MAYIGNTPALQYITFAKQTFTADSSTVAFTLDNSVANENELEVFVNNVRQEPGSGKAYTASGTTLTMSEAPTTGDDFYCIYQGKATQTVTPGASTVTNAMLAGSIDLTSKVTGALPVANGGTNLTSGFANGITMADQWRLTTSFAITSQSDTFVTSNLEQVDTSGQGTFGSAMTESSGVFTFPETGIYLVSTIAQFYIPDDARWIQASIYVTTNNSSYTQVSGNYGFTQITQSSNTYIAVPTSTYVDVTDTSNVKVKFAYARVDPNSVNVTGDSNINQTHYTFIRLGDT